jgi:hypothetical protein
MAPIAPSALRFATGHASPATGGDIEIHRVVLRRIDGSEVRRNFVAVSVHAPRVGSTILLATSDDRSVRVQAKITAVKTVTFASRDGRPGTVDVTVHAQELMCVPVADNDP